MDNQHRNEWYGPEATMFKKCDGYNLINYQCEGTGTCLDYSLFPGIDLIFMDFNCSDTFREPMVNRDILDIRHYRQGRVEFEFQNQKAFHMRENEFCINTLTNMPASYSFPLGKCSGVSFVIDRDSLDSATIRQLSLYGIDIKNLGRHLELDAHWYICKTPQNLLHIFDELYEAKGKESAAYFRIKILELLYPCSKAAERGQICSGLLFQRTYRNCQAGQKAADWRIGNENPAGVSDCRREHQHGNISGHL